MKKKVLFFIIKCLGVYLLIGTFIFFLVPYGNLLRVNIFGLIPAIFMVTIYELLKFVVKQANK